jgi:tRNA pseudouridine38-40 synthase
MCAPHWRQKSMTTNNWKLTLAYDGTAFHGWQVQPGGKTIQGTLSDAITAVAGERVLPQGAGRTDAGVHAAGQVASFALAAPIPPGNFLRALNRVLPAAIRVLAAEKAAPDFHARHRAGGKIYQYRVFHGPVCSPFLAPYVACSRWPLDLGAMQQAAKAILGEHDFSSFAASDPDRGARLAKEEHRSTTNTFDLDAPMSQTASNLRRIDDSQWVCESLCGESPTALDALAKVYPHAPDREQNRENCTQIFTYTICGNGFLHHMVRNLVGTFLEVGRGRIAAADILRIMHGRDRTLAGPTAPAAGLCLMKVLYWNDKPILRTGFEMK